MTYDLYVWWQAEAELKGDKEWETLLETLKADAKAVSRRVVEGIGFTGLELSSYEQGEKLLRIIAKYDGSCYIVDSKYRVAKVSSEEAIEIAQAEIGRIREKYSGERFDEPVIVEDPARFFPQHWTAVSKSPSLMQKGYLPGAVIVHVDKLDGHIVGEDEVKTMAEQHEQARRGSSCNSRPKRNQLL